MPGGDIIMLSKKELRRVPVVHQVKEGKITQVEAGRILDLSDRQIRRIVGRVCKEGEKGIAHHLFLPHPSASDTDSHAKNLRILQ